MNIHYMVLLLELLGHSYIKLKNYDKFVKKYPISKYISIMKQDLNLYDEFIHKKTPSCYAFTQLVEIVKNMKFDDMIVSDITTSTVHS